MRELRVRGTRQLLPRYTYVVAMTAGPSGRRAPNRIGKLWSSICCGFSHGVRGDLRPPLAQTDGFVHSVEELLLTVIVPPPPAVVQLEEVRASALGKNAPPVRDLLECMEG